MNDNVEQHLFLLFVEEEKEGKQLDLVDIQVSSKRVGAIASCGVEEETKHNRRELVYRITCLCHRSK